MPAWHWLDGAQELPRGEKVGQVLPVLVAGHPGFAPIGGV
jgi:hypothetical protein